jgi:transcription elongation factor S-II
MPKIKLSYSNTSVQVTSESIDALRKSVVQRIQQIIDDYIESTQVDVTEWLKLEPAINIERGIYNVTIQHATQANIARKWSNLRFLDIYKQRMISVITNLDNQSYVQNKTLLPRIIHNEMMPHEVAFLTPSELCPERWVTVLENLQHNETDYVPTEFVTMYRCSKCGERKTTIHELQTRSADEPMTLFITCFNCKHKWRG